MTAASTRGLTARNRSIEKSTFLPASTHDWIWKHDDQTNAIDLCQGLRLAEFDTESRAGEFGAVVERVSDGRIGLPGV
jgi:hypothetical protein